jgi:hypothetical protein
MVVFLLPGRFGGMLWNKNQLQLFVCVVCIVCVCVCVVLCRDAPVQYETTNYRIGPDNHITNRFTKINSSAVLGLLNLGAKLIAPHLSGKFSFSGKILLEFHLH